MQYLTPGVYVEEISLLPPSVVEVATAIPAFIGYTEIALDDNGINQTGVVVKRIDSFKEYTDLFGGPLSTHFDAVVSTDANNVSSIALTAKESNGTTNLGTLPQFLMYYSLKMYFDNGGGTCYIVSVGQYGSVVPTMAPADFRSGLDAIRREDEPTLLVLVDAVHLSTDYVLLCQDVLAQCGDLKDRFGIFDVLEGDTDAANFRNGIGINQLKYGAAYTPYLRSGLTHIYAETDVDISTFRQADTGANGLKIFYQGSATPAVTLAGTGSAPISFAIDAGTGALTIDGLESPGQTPADLLLEWNQLSQGEKGGYELFVEGDGSANVLDTSTVSAFATVNMSDLELSYTQIYNQLKTDLAKQRIVLPPASAMAGVYARVDRNRGVWKAPANVSVSNVLEPAEKINNTEQGRLNIDPTGGKSINAIRSFAGKGTLVWGARTLAGNDNEWRYINVRRLFILIEESVQKSTGFVVFEGNDATTWLKVKALVESYLYGLWQKGALAGPTAESAYFVNVGLGKTMTTQDVLEGRLIVEIGVAAVRPAEFIILRFFHKLQEA